MDTFTISIIHVLRCAHASLLIILPRGTGQTSTIVNTSAISIRDLAKRALSGAIIRTRGFFTIITLTISTIRGWRFYRTVIRTRGFFTIITLTISTIRGWRFYRTVIRTRGSFTRITDSITTIGCWWFSTTVIRTRGFFTIITDSIPTIGCWWLYRTVIRTRGFFTRITDSITTIGWRRIVITSIGTVIRACELFIAFACSITTNANYRFGTVRTSVICFP